MQTRNVPPLLRPLGLAAAIVGTVCIKKVKYFDLNFANGR